MKYFYILLIVFILSMLGSFAFFSWESQNSDNTNVSFDVVADSVYIYYDAGSNINGGDLYPTDDKNDGISKDITVKISGVTESKPVAFNLYLDLIDVPDELMDDSFKWALYKGSEEKGTGSITKNIIVCTDNDTKHIILFSDNITTVEKQNYILYLWIDGNMTNPDTMMNQSFKVNLHADGTNATLIEGNSMSLISLERNGGNNVNMTLQSLMYNFDSYAISGDGTTEPTSWTDMGCGDNSCDTNDKNTYKKTLNNIDLNYIDGLSYVWLKNTEGRVVKIEIGKNYAITLNNNGATTVGTTNVYGIYKDGFYKDSSYKEKYETNEKITVPFKTNYGFLGYYDSNDNEVIDSDGNFITDSENKYYDDVTLNAKWDAKAYTIAYDCNGGSGSVSDTTINYGDSVTISANACSKTGYSFVGWTTNSNGTDDGFNWTGWSGTWVYGDGQYGIKDRKLALYARWTPNKIKLTINGNGGTVGTTAVWYYYGTNILYSDENCTNQVTSITVPTRLGYTLVHLYGDGSSGGDNGERYIFRGGDWAEDLVTDIYKDATLYANWTPNKIKLTINANGGTVGTTAVWYYYGTSTFYSDESCTNQITSITVPTMSGYTFAHLYGDGTSGGDNGERYIFGDGTFAGDLATDIYKDATLYAFWARYLLYDANGNSLRYVTTLSDAVSYVPSGGTILVMNDDNSGSVSISKNVTLDTNGRIITMSGTITNSDGYTLSITGNGKITSSSSINYLIVTGGTTNLTSATLECLNCSSVVLQKGNFNMFSGSVINSTSDTGNTSANRAFINSFGSLNVSSGIIKSNNGTAIYLFGGDINLITTNTNEIELSGKYYGIFSDSYRTDNSNINISSGLPGNIKIFTTVTNNGSDAVLVTADDSNSTYYTVTTISGASLYADGHVISNAKNCKMTLGSNVTAESRNTTILNAGTLYLGSNPESITLDKNSGQSLSIANANYNYIIFNYSDGTVFMGGGAYLYDTRDTSSITTDYSKKPIANYGTFNLYGGRIYYNFGVDSAFYNLENGIVNQYQDSNSWWDVNKISSTYIFQYYNVGASYTISKYSYRKGKS